MSVKTRLALVGGDPITHATFPFDDPGIDADDLRSVVACAQSEKLSMFYSDEVRSFEEEFSTFVGCAHTVLFTSCTVSLHAALLAAGVRPRDHVVVPAYTYVGSAMPVLLAGAEPLFADIELESFGMDPDHLSRLVSAHPVSAIVLVHLFGAAAKQDDILSIARCKGIPVIHDCAQALGTRLSGKHVGVDQVACFSFGDSKVLKIGEGGALCTNSKDIASRAALVRHEGEVWKRAGLARAAAFNFTADDIMRGLDYVATGSNYRPSALLAALARSKLRKLPTVLAQREMLASVLLDELRTLDDVVLPKVNTRSFRSWISFPVMLQNGVPRDTVLAALCAEGIPAGVHFPTPLPQHTVFSQWNRQS